jgi:hypothetical protein
MVESMRDAVRPARTNRIGTTLAFHTTPEARDDVGAGQCGPKSVILTRLPVNLADHSDTSKEVEGRP